MTIKQLVKKAHDWAVRKGFWNYKCDECGNDYTPNKNFFKSLCPTCGESNMTKRNDGEMIALMHSELSEMLEELRKSEVDWEKVGEELADVFIRGADYAGGRGIDLQKHIEQKMKKNEKRPHKHGKKF